jgi:hypothetical protein
MTEDLTPELGAYVDGELDASGHERIEELMRRPECQELAATFQWLDQIAGSESVPTVSDTEWAAVKASVLAQAHAEPVPAKPESEDDRVIRPRGRFGTPVRVLAVAALLLVAVAVGWALRGGNDSGGGNDGAANGAIVDPSGPNRTQLPLAGDLPDGDDGEGDDGEGDPDARSGSDPLEGVDPEEASYAERGLYAPKVESEDGDDHTSVYYGEDF